SSLSYRSSSTPSRVTVCAAASSMVARRPSITSMPWSSHHPGSCRYAWLRGSRPARYPLDSGGRSYGGSVSSPTSTTRPVKPSSRRTSAALPPAREAPTMTNTRWSVLIPASLGANGEGFGEAREEGRVSRHPHQALPDRVGGRHFSGDQGSKGGASLDHEVRRRGWASGRHHVVLSGHRVHDQVTDSQLIGGGRLRHPVPVRGTQRHDQAIGRDDLLRAGFAEGESAPPAEAEHRWLQLPSPLG